MLNKFVAFLLLLVTPSLYAQQNPRQSNVTGMKVLGSAVAAEFGKWSMLSRGVITSGSRTVTLELSSFNVPDGMSIMPISTSIPLLIVDGPNTETVTPSAVNCSMGSGICTFTATFANSHLNNFFVRSGTKGFQEAALEMSQSGGMVLVTPDWTGLTSYITNATGSANVSVWDTRAGSVNFYSWDGSHFVVTWGINVNGSVTPATIAAVSVINNRRYCNGFPGADASLKMQACADDLPSTGGVADATGIEGIQSGTVNPLAHRTSGNVTLLLGAMTLTTTVEWLTPKQSQVLGLGRQTTIIKAANGYSAAHVLQAGDGSGPSNVNFHGIWFKHLTVDCNAIAGLDGVFTEQAQEPGGIDDVEFISCMGSAMNVRDGSQNWGPFTNIQAGWQTNTNMTVNTRCLSVTTYNFGGVYKMTCDSSGRMVAATNAIYSAASWTHYQVVHVEGFCNAIFFTQSIGTYYNDPHYSQQVSMTDLTTGNTNTGCAPTSAVVQIDSNTANQNIEVTNVTNGGSFFTPYTLRDQITGYSLTYDKGGIGKYVIGGGANRSLSFTGDASANAPNRITGSLTTSGALHTESAMTVDGSLSMKPQRLVNQSGAVVINTALGSIISIGLVGDAAGFTFSNPDDGKVIVVRVCQDGPGLHGWLWPIEFHAAGKINPLANSCSVQAFWYDAQNVNWWAWGPMAYEAPIDQTLSCAGGTAVKTGTIRDGQIVTAFTCGAP